MLIENKESFLNKSKEALSVMYDTINNLKTVSISEFQAENTALVIVDIVNGFVREGMLKSERVEGIIEPSIKLMKTCEKVGIKKVAFADCHSEKSVEFEAYPPHCVRGTTEAEIVDEIAKEGNYTLIEKNSTNGFMEKEFQNWIEENKISNFIVIGDCTDICVMHFTLSLKTYFNSKDINSRIVVPINAVETYDLNEHYGELMNVMALQIMRWNGIEIAKSISE